MSFNNLSDFLGVMYEEIHDERVWDMWVNDPMKEKSYEERLKESRAKQREKSTEEKIEEAKQTESYILGKFRSKGGKIDG